MKTVLMTGAGGSVGSMLRPELTGKYNLRLSDIRKIRDLGANETFVAGDITRLDHMLRVTKGVDAIIHLGGFSVEGPWDTILQANIIGCYNVFEAARINGVKRILFATSNHACGFYRRDEKIDHRVYPKPDSRYGVSKVFGEQIGSLYADKYGLEVFNIRIGNTAREPVDKRRLSIWVSPRDLAQLMQIGIDHPDVRFEIVYGVSGNARSWYDNSNARRLGYRPQDDSEPYAQDVLAKEKPAQDPKSEDYQGGTFVSAEIGGDPSRVTPKVKSARKGPKKAAPKAPVKKPAAKKAAAKKPATKQPAVKNAPAKKAPAKKAPAKKTSAKKKGR
jgi:uronate dehydrogenase